MPVFQSCTGIGSCSTACNVYLATWIITGVVLFTQLVPFFLSIAMCVKGQRLNERRPSIASTDSMMSEDGNGVSTHPANPVRQWRHDCHDNCGQREP